MLSDADSRGLPQGMLVGDVRQLDNPTERLHGAQFQAGIRPAVLPVVAALALAILVAGCARPASQRVRIDDEALRAEERLQRSAAYGAQHGHEKRLWRIGALLRRAATGLCADRVRRELGFSLKDLGGVHRDYRDVAGDFGIRERPVVQVVLGDSPAERSGILPGDEVLALDDISFEGEEALSVSDLDQRRLARATEDGLVRVDVLRSGKRRTFRVATENYCDYGVVLLNNDKLNAFADGDSIMVTRRMMSFAAADQELAFIVSHELAHNALEHVQAQTTNALGGLVVDIAVAVATGGAWAGGFSSAAKGMYSHEFEAEADYVGLYMMANAGMEIDGAADFWRKLAVETGNLNTRSSSHPSMPERFLAMGKVVEEINAKRQAGEALTPNLGD